VVLDPGFEECLLGNYPEPHCQRKTKFSTGQGLWQFTVIYFGLCNASATFERLIESVLWGLTYDACLVFLDDANIVGRTFKQQPDNLQKVFPRACLEINHEKCRLFLKKLRQLERKE
jgi:hypothetical protein